MIEQQALQADRTRYAALDGDSKLRGSYSENVLLSLRDPVLWLRDIHPDGNDETVFWVESRNSRGQFRRVQFVGDDWIICSCDNGRHAGSNARCYHAAMVELSR